MTFMGTLERWEPTSEQQGQYEAEGYFILRGVLSAEAATEAKGVVKNTILLPEPDVRADTDPMDPMGSSPEAQAARFRKLTDLGIKSPLVWNSIYQNPQLLAAARYFLGDDLLLKFNSTFLKPARTGSATPWHQDNGLWRDGETQPFNYWVALDAATRENGCLQFIPGSHRTEIIPHVLYADSVHGEIPRERVRELSTKNGLHHIELAPGDAVCWHSTLWHYSPPNTSEKGRIGIAGVVSTPELAAKNLRFKRYFWLMRNGETVTGFPPEVHLAPGTAERPPAWERVEEASAA